MKYEDFVQKKGKENPSFAFWNSYIDMVQILLFFLRATHESDWGVATFNYPRHDAQVLLLQSGELCLISSIILARNGETAHHTPRMLHRIQHSSTLESSIKVDTDSLQSRVTRKLNKPEIKIQKPKGGLTGLTQGSLLLNLVTIWESCFNDDSVKWWQAWLQWYTNRKILISQESRMMRQCIKCLLWILNGWWIHLMLLKTD